jgi:O-glycosyl hydrolase
MRRIVAVVLAAVLLNAPGAHAQDEPARHRVDVSQRFQSIDHFGASDCWTTKILDTWSEEARTRVADLLFSPEKGIGLSLWRFNLGAGLQHDRIKEPLRTTESFEIGPGKYDWSRMAAERWMLLAAKKLGVGRFHAFSLSGTPRMTRNGFVNADPGANTTNLKRDAEGDYARYLADILEHFAQGYPAEQRVAFDWISPFNEPQWDWNGGSQEGTRASNDDMRRVALLLDAELRKRHLATRVHLAESGSIPDMTAANAAMTKKHGSLFGDYVDAFCGDKTLRECLDKTIGYHAYWSDGGDVFGKHREALRRKLDAFPGWRVFQTEYCIMQKGRDLGMDSALHVARVMHGDLSIVNVSGWSWWLALSPHDYKDGLLYTDWKAKGDAETVLPSKMLWAVGHYSRFVRPGMVRVAIEGAPLQNHAGLLATAYLDEKSGRVVVVYVNSGATPIAVRVDVAGDARPRKTQSAWVTSSAPGDDLRALDATAAGETLTVPARAFVTVVVE